MHFQAHNLLIDNLSFHLKCKKVDTRVIHSLSLKIGCLFSIYLSNNILYSYVSSSNFVSACKMFEEIPKPNVVSWNARITCSTLMGDIYDAVLLYKRMQNLCLAPDAFTFGSILPGCARFRDWQTGIQIHCSIIKLGYDFNLFVSSTLIDMYGKCGKFDDCWKVFNSTPNKNVASWTTMISNFVGSKDCIYKDYAFSLFKDMVSMGVHPMSITFTSLVKVFDEANMLDQAKQVHGFMIKIGTEVDDHLKSAILAMYGRCGGLDEAIKLSLRMKHDVVSYTSLLMAYTKNGHGVEAIKVLRRMVKENLTIDQFVIATIIGACSLIGQIRMGKEVHGYALRRYHVNDISVGNSLISLYGRCGKILNSEKVFQSMDDGDTITCTTLLTSYSQNYCAEKALSLYQILHRKGSGSSIFEITCAIIACSHIANISIGGQMHSKVIKLGIDANLSVGNSLITMYAKCGNIMDASQMFSSMTDRDIVSWNALIVGFSYYGLQKETFELLDQMSKDGVKPDDCTFVGILISCSRAGLVSKGCEYFKLMNAKYGLEPKMKHYACIVDLLGRAGKLNEALEFIYCMPFEPDYLIWEALLASCKLHGDINVADFAAKKILNMKLKESSPYVTLSSIHASMGMWNKKAGLLDKSRECGTQKKPGMSWIESHNRMIDIKDILVLGDQSEYLMK